MSISEIFVAVAHI